MGSEIKRCNPPDLGYMAFHSDADRRHKRGERQVYCGVCKRWQWPEHVSDEHRPHTLTRQQFDAAVRRIEKEVEARYGK